MSGRPIKRTLRDRKRHNHCDESVNVVVLRSRSYGHCRWNRHDAIHAATV